MNLDRIAVLFPRPELTLDGQTHSTDPVDVRTLTGEHDLTGSFAFRQMNADDYEWLKQQEQAVIEQVHSEEVGALTVELVQKDYQILTGEELE